MGSCPWKMKKNNFKEISAKHIKKDSRQEWLEGFIGYLSHKILHLTDEQKNDIWDCLNGMLSSIVEYRIITGDFA